MEGVYTNMSFVEWMTEALSRYWGKDLLKISMIYWSIWKNRNDIVWNQKGAEFEVVAFAIIVLKHGHKHKKNRLTFPLVL